MNVEGNEAYAANKSVEIWMLKRFDRVFVEHRHIVFSVLLSLI